MRSNFEDRDNHVESHEPKPFAPAESEEAEKESDTASQEGGAGGYPGPKGGGTPQSP